MEEGKDKHQEKISLEQESLGCLEEGITIAVIAHHNTTITMEDTTADTIMDTTLGTTTDTTMELVDQTMEVMDITADTTVDPPGVSVTTDLYSKTSMVLHMVHVREGMRLVRDGVILRGMAVRMPGSLRDSLTTPGHT